MESIQKDDLEHGRMTLWEHLEELRKRLAISIVVLFTGFIACWFYREPIFDVVQAPFLRFISAGDRLSFISLTEPFFVYMKVAALAALIFTSPIIITQLWLFIAPGLYRKEKMYAIPFIFFSTIFFLGGCVFCYYYIFPFACKYFLEVGSRFKQEVRVNDYFSLFSKLTLAVGLIFEIPILAFFLAKLGIINHHFLLNKFKYAVLLSFVLSAIITPTPDVITQSFLALPMIILYILSIVIAWIFGKKYD